MSKDENETLTRFDNEIRQKCDGFSEKIFGTKFVPAFNWMLLQSLLNPDTALEMHFAENNLANMLRMMSDYEYQSEIQSQAENFKSNELKDLTKTMHSIDGMLSALWYSKLPCYDIDQVTSEMDGEAGLLKLCKWKGKKIPCFKIFKKVTTDQGICCAFNMEQADKIFVESEYTTTIKRLQKEEEELAFPGGNLTGWDWYLRNKEPQSQSGNKMGLTVVLDAHTDLILEHTINTDFKEITAAIIPPGDFPLTSQNPIKIKPGHNNMIALMATKISSNPDIQNYNPAKRKCFFEDETSFIKLHKNYSQMNCLFECSLVQAKKATLIDCNPWFFPSIETTERVCDPWEKTRVLEAMQNDVPLNACEYCWPDCDRIIYHPMVTTQEFRVCNEKNFGMTDLCSFDAIDVWPQIWGDQVLDQSNGAWTYVNGTNIYKKIKSSMRVNTLFIPINNNSNEPKLYDAYQDDIAVVNVYFSSPTVIKFTSRINKTWIDFLSGIGGNVGLFIGFSFVTIFELLWLLFKVLWVYFDPSK